MRLAKTSAGVVDLKRVRNDAFGMAGARISCFVRLMFHVWDAQSVEGLQILDSGHAILCRDDFAWQIQDFVCLS